jgi:chromosome segregation ATPase
MSKRQTGQKIPRLQQVTSTLLVEMLRDMNKKIHELHKDVERNNAELQELKEQLAMSKGGLRVVLWIFAMLTTILGIYQYFKNGS